MTKNIIACSDVGWDDRSPAVVIGDHLIRGPVSVRHRGGVYEASSRDLRPEKLCLVYCLAWSIAICQIFDDWAFMGGWPRCPLILDLTSSFDGCGGHGIRGSNMADHICRCEVVWRNESIVEVLRDLPAYGDRSWGDVLIRGIISIIAVEISAPANNITKRSRKQHLLNTISHDTRDRPMRHNGGHQDQQRKLREHDFRSSVAQTQVYHQGGSILQANNEYI